MTLSIIHTPSQGFAYRVTLGSLWIMGFWIWVGIASGRTLRFLLACVVASLCLFRTTTAHQAQSVPPCPCLQDLSAVLSARSGGHM
ncbi:hypothetical protein F5883DRAFT_538071 [Diaporthe sp. PMI_573]|nr:hypothetical protein F5883DRAFT_538071 [Diaporthaceae sp. PMI_573]